MHREFPPPIKGLNAVTTNDRTESKAPMIEQYNSNAPPFLGTLVSAYLLGGKLQYRPFQEHALKGLSCLSTTANDPIAALEQIYCRSTSPSSNIDETQSLIASSELREWVKRWLAVVHLGAEAATYLYKFNTGISYRTNLAVLKYCPSWVDKYRQLKHWSSELREDETSVENHLSMQYGRDRTAWLVGPPTAGSWNMQAVHGIQGWGPIAANFQQVQNFTPNHYGGYSSPDSSGLSSSLSSLALNNTSATSSSAPTPTGFSFSQGYSDPSRQNRTYGGQTGWGH